jgi:hypothetical protein
VALGDAGIERAALPLLVLLVAVAPRPLVPGATLTLEQLRALALLVGFPPSSLDTAAAVAMAESQGNPLAVGDGGTSFGLWQVHVPAHPEFSSTSLRDAVYNARAALAISGGGTNWQPWSTWTSGAYRQYL